MEEDTELPLQLFHHRNNTVMTDWVLFKHFSIYQTHVYRTNLWLINKLSQPDYCKWLLPCWTGGLIIGRWLTGGWGTNQSPWQSTRCFPLDLLRLTRDQCWRLGLEKVASVLQPCLCVRQVTGPSQRVTQRECLCTLEYFSVLWKIYDFRSS